MDPAKQQPPTTSSQNNYQPFPEEQNEIELTNDDGVTKETVKLDNIDPIFAETFRSMITDHFAEGKHFFVAKILSKNVNWAAATSTLTTATQATSSNSQVAPSAERPSQAASPADQSDTKVGGGAANVNFSHFFNAHGILKILFKKRGTEFVGRFHERYPITAKNPITNCRIIGEVEFYKITNPRIQQQATTSEEQKSDSALQPPQSPKSSNQGLAAEAQSLQESPAQQNLLVSRRSEVKNLTGEFFGTDFNFLYSEEMQRALAQNCLSTNWDSLMNFSQWHGGQIQEEIGQFINNQGAGGIQLDLEINEIVRESFKTTKKYIWKGVFSFLFYFAALYTLKDGVLPIMASSFPGTRTDLADKLGANTNIPDTSSTDPQSSEDEGDAQQPDKSSSSRYDLQEIGYTPNILHVLFPVFGMLYHYQLCLVHNKREYVFFFVIKTALFLGFLFISIYTWVTQQTDFLTLTSIVLTAVPIASLIYSYMIFNVKYMSVGRYLPPNGNERDAGQDNAQADGAVRPHNRHRRRYADAADLDERQEVAIREFQVRHQNVQVDFDNRNFALGLAEAGQELVDFNGDDPQAPNAAAQDASRGAY